METRSITSSNIQSVVQNRERKIPVKFETEDNLQHFSKTSKLVEQRRKKKENTCRTEKTRIRKLTTVISKGGKISVRYSEITHINDLANVLFI